MGFIDEHHNGRWTGLHFVNDLAQTVFKLTFHRSTSLQQAHIQHQQAYIAQCGRHVTTGNAQGEAFDHRRFTHPGLTGQDRVVLTAPHEHVDDLADFFVPAHNRVNLAVPRLFCQVGAELLQRFAFAHFRRAHRAGGFAGYCAAARLAAILRRQAVFGRTIGDFREIIGQIVGPDLGQFR